WRGRWPTCLWWTAVRSKTSKCWSTRTKSSGSSSRTASFARTRSFRSKTGDACMRPPLSFPSILYSRILSATGDGDGYEFGAFFEFSAFVQGQRLDFSDAVRIPGDGFRGRSHTDWGLHHLRLVHYPAVESACWNGYRLPTGDAAV